MTSSSKSFKIRITCLLILVSLIFALVSCGDNSTNKAKEFMAANMYEQAIDLLEQELQNKPKNATAHLLLGECKLVTGRFSEAQKSFKSATVLQPDLGMKIGEVAVSAAKTALREQKYSQAFQIMSLAKKYDPKTSKISSEICIAKAKELFGKKMFSEGISFLKYSLSQDPSKDKEISGILMELIVVEAKSLKGVNLDEMVAWCIQLDKSKSQNIGKLYFDIGTTILESSDRSVSSAIKNGFSLAVKYDGSLSSSVAKFLQTYAQNSKQLESRIEAAYMAGTYDRKLSDDISKLLISSAREAYEKGKTKTFIRAIESAKKIAPSMFKNGSDVVRCLDAIYFYEVGNRVRAIKELKKLKKSSDAFAKKASSDLLSPPSVGKHAVGKSTSWKDLGRPGPMVVTLVDYTITENKEIVLHFEAINKSSGSNKLLFAYRYDSYNGEDRPYIVDDNGSKFLPKRTFKGGRIDEFNSYVRQILFNKGESIEFTIAFPITSEGAKSFDFISPQLNGWQWKWGISNISLR